MYLYSLEVCDVSGDERIYGLLPFQPRVCAQTCRVVRNCTALMCRAHSEASVGRMRFAHTADAQGVSAQPIASASKINTRHGGFLKRLKPATDSQTGHLRRYDYLGIPLESIGDLAAAIRIELNRIGNEQANTDNQWNSPGEN